MDETCDSRKKQRIGEAERHPLVFEIALSHRTGMIQEPSANHDASPQGVAIIAGHFQEPIGICGNLIP